MNESVHTSSNNFYDKRVKPYRVPVKWYRGLIETAPQTLLNGPAVRLNRFHNEPYACPSWNNGK